MKRIAVSSLKKGDKFSRPVYLDADTVFISSNSPVTESDLERLAKYGITEVFTEGNLLPVDSGERPQSKSVDDKLPFLDQSEDGLRLKVIYDKITHSRYEFDTLYYDVSSVIRTSFQMIREGKNVEIRDYRNVAERLADFYKSNSQAAVYLNSKFVGEEDLIHQATYATFFALLLATQLEYSRPKLIDLALASMVADVGMTTIPGNIVEKSNRLDENEKKVIMKHTLMGYQILTQKVKLKNTLAIVALQHHESYDGTGYPQKMSGAAIEEFSRVFTIADTYAALISKRPYRNPYLPHEAMKLMIGEMVNKFDLKLVRMFLNMLSMYPLGSYVELSDGRIGMVVDVNKDKPIRPSVRIIKESGGNKVKTLQFVNLAQDLQLYIVKPVDGRSL
jgi:HD-GYP domain-containing protein (c-di-GMP phosphodiesterase class II)